MDTSLKQVNLVWDWSFFAQMGIDIHLAWMFGRFVVLPT